ncbi:MAG: hypothetical protein WAN48_11515 [Actinomycetes bacterium]
MTIPILATPVRDWYCPNCGLTHQTNDPRIAVPLHPCPKLRGLMAPMVVAGTTAKVELREREDYVGTDLVQVDPELGRPVMSIVTTRDEGTDARIFVPTAVATAKE